MKRSAKALWALVLSLMLCLVCIASVAEESGEPNRYITITAGDTVVYKGKTLALKAEVEALSDEAPAKTTLRWSTSDKTIATVSEKGQVKGVAAGTATITCAAKDDPRISATFEVEVRVSAKSVKLSDKKLSLLIGGSAESAEAALVCTVSPETAYERSVTWTSSDEAVATVDENGVVRAVGVGKATITAKAVDPAVKQAATCTVTVARSVTSVTISSSREMIYTGKKLSLTAEALPEDAGSLKIKWSSSDKTIATVSEKGVVTGKKPGTVTITAEAADGSGESAECVVNVIHAVKSLSLPAKKAQLVLGGSESGAQLQLEAQLKPADAYYQDVVWTSSDEAIATVSENGMVQALQEGEVTITVATTDPSSTASASIDITVGKAVESITLSHPTLVLQRGKSYKPTATVAPADALNTKLIWSSSDETVATVDAKGKVTAKAQGNATVYATAADGSGVQVSCDVTVVELVTKITTSKTKAAMFAGRTMQLSAKVHPSDATEQTILWATSNEKVATVSSTGLVEAKSAGSVVIFAVAADGTGVTAPVKITVEPAVPITLKSLGFGIYMPNLMGLTVFNGCRTMKVADFDFDMTLYGYNGNIINSGSFSLGKDTSIAPGATRTIKRNVSGAGYATKVTITITGVSFKDGTYYSIPSHLRQTWTFRR